MGHIARRLQVFLAALWMVVFAASTPVQADEGPAMRALEVEDFEGVFADAPGVPEGWRTVDALYTRIHAHPDDLETARLLASHADASVPKLAAALGIPSGPTIEVFIAPTQQAFQTLQPGRPPEWADGTAWPQRGLIYLRSPDIRPGFDEPLTQVLDHELVHIILGRSFAPRPVPHWLQEGAAQLLARQYKPELTDRLAEGLLGDSLLSLDELTGSFPASGPRARLAYAQSADLVAYLQNTYGADTLSRVTLGLAAGNSVDESLRNATGATSTQLDRAWRERLSSSPMWLKPLVDDSTLFAFAGIVFVVGGVLVRRRRQRILERWAREEVLQDAVYAALVGPWHHAGQPLRPLPPLGVLQATAMGSMHR